MEMIWHLAKIFWVKNRDTLKHVNNSLKIGAGETLIQLTSEKLEVGATYDWAVSPRCGAVIVFSGTVRDHADGRVDVTALHYEAYETEVLTKLAAIVAEMRSKWPQLGRIALIHRVGTVGLGESSVLVVVSAPHRPEAFAAARFGIDALKATVPIWKREKWAGGDDWGTAAHDLIDIKDVVAPDHEGSQA
jgi:molybdopterin synthase catalytic subunit